MQLKKEENSKISNLKPWLKFYEGHIFDEKTCECSLYEAIKDTNKDNLESDAIFYYGTTIKYKELFDRIDHYAKCFVSRGLNKGDCVSFLTLAFPESISALYALNKIGVTVNLIDPRMDVKRIKKSIEISNSRMLYVFESVYKKIEGLLPELNLDLVIVHSASESLGFIKRCIFNLKKNEHIDYGEKIIKNRDFLFLDKDIEVESVSNKDDVAAITQTGGTTGTPKSVMLTNYSINVTARNCEFMYAYGDINVNGFKWLDIIPMFTSYGLVCGIHIPLITKGKVIIHPNFKPDLFPELIAKYKPNSTIAVPAYYEMLTNDARLKDMDMSFVKLYISGGDTMTRSFEEKINSFLKEHNCSERIAQGYGMSELSSIVTFNSKRNIKTSSVGIPIYSSTVAIFDSETGEELGFNEIGEVCVSGPTLMKGYLKDKKETDNVMKTHKDGKVWIHSGDYGLIDEDGFLFIKGRIKRMITRFDGHKIFPVQIESLVSSYQGVVNCCVIPVLDSEHGSYGQCHLPLVLATVSRNIDKQKAKEDLLKLCDSKLEERGKPCDVVIVDNLPLTSFGKIDLNKLTKEYLDYNYR